MKIDKDKKDPLNGYKWGVEYKANGVNPDLHDDVAVEWVNCHGILRINQLKDLSFAKSFRIVDERYKPAAESAQPECGWWDYENDKPIGLPAPNEKILVTGDGSYTDGTVFAFDQGLCVVRFENVKICGIQLFKDYTYKAMQACYLRPADYLTRKAEQERKKVIEAAQKECVNFSSSDLVKLYDAGFLKLPDQICFAAAKID